MQSDPQFKKLARVVEYWTRNRAVGSTYAALEGVNGQTSGCILIVINNMQRAKLKDQVAEHVEIMTLDEAKEGKLEGYKLPMVMDHFAIQQLIIEMSGVGMKHGELEKARVYNTLLTNGMIKPEYQKQIYIRAKEIEEKT